MTARPILLAFALAGSAPAAVLQVAPSPLVRVVRASRRPRRRRETVGVHPADPATERPLCERLSARVGADVCALFSSVAPQGAAL